MSTIGVLMACPECSLPVPDGARFCPSCGASIPGGQNGQSVVGDERRVVTILFADLVGFTSLAEQRDPEQVKRLVDAAFEQLVADVERHGGVVDKVLGDAIVALFGAPTAHEDDADRAVRAGLAMQTSLRRFRDEHPAESVRIRVGINTGEVLVGTLAGTDYTAMGDVVNIASRLQDLAPPGSVLVGDDTRQLCSPALRFRPFEMIQLRGRAQELQVWLAVALDTAIAVRRWESDVPFVGRTVEIDMLTAVTSIVATGRSAVVAVAGEAGIGKSRLVAEALEPFVDARPGTMLLEGACAPYGEANVWWPVAAGILARLHLDRDTAPEESRRRIVRGLGRLDGFEQGTGEFDRLVEVVMYLVGHPSALDGLGPTAMRDAVLAGVVAGLRRRAAIAPVVVWIDDLQWAAPLLLDLLESVARRMSDLPLLVVATYRPSEEDAEEWPPPADPALSLHLPLAPLDETESAALVEAAAGRALSADVVRRVSERSGGNPLFLIELARLASADPEGSDPAELPGSVRALIAARIDALAPSQRSVLDNAAIIGNEGRVAELEAFAGEMHQPYDPDDLHGIESKGLLVCTAGRWRFRSDVVREVAYHTLTKQSRALRHAGVARYMAAHEKPSVEALAYHTAAAAELVAELGPIDGVPDDIGHEAQLLSIQAAQLWYRQGAYRRGLQIVERGLAFAEVGSGTHLSLLRLLAGGLVEARSHDRARAVLAELEALTSAPDDRGGRVVQGEIHRLRGQIDQMEGDLVAARRELGSAVAEFRELGDEAHLAEALRARGFAEVFGGSLSEAEWFLGEADELFERIGDERGRAWVLQNRAWVSFLAGDHAESERRLDLALELFRRFDDREGENWARGLLAYVRHFGRRNAEAEVLAASVLADAREWGDDWGAAMMLNLRASIRLWAGDVDDARSLAERALAGFRRIQDRFGMIQALGTLNRAYVALGRLGDADRTVEEVLVLSDSFGELAYPALAAAGTAMHLGQGERAAELAAEAVGRLDTTGANVDEGRVLTAFGHLLTGDVDGALAQLLAVDVERSPFALAARATASAMIGDCEAALSDVRMVAAMDDVSYWDRAVAEVAGAAAGTGIDLVALGETVPDTMLRAYVHDVVAARKGEGMIEPPTGPAIGGWHDIAMRLAAT